MRDSPLAVRIERLAWLAVVAAATLAPFQPLRPLADGMVADLRTAPTLAALAVALWLAALAVARRRPRLPWPLWPALAAFLVVALLTSLLAPSDRFESLKFSGRLWLGGALALAAADLLTSRGRRWTLALALVVAGTVQGTLGIAEFAAWQSILPLLAPFRIAPTQVGDLVRVSGTFIYPTITSMYLELVIPFGVAALWLAITTRRWAWAALAALAVAVMLLGMTLTFTRSGLVATAVALMVMGVAAGRRGARRQMAATAAAAATLVVVVLGVAGVTPAIALRLQTENDRAWYGVVYAPAPLPPLAAGETASLPVTVTNTGRLTWYPSPLRGYSLAYHWLAHDEDSVAVWDGVRTPLPGALAPGQSATLQATVTAPVHSGPFRLAWDVVQDNVTWFSAKAVPMGVQRVEVQPTAVQPAVEPPPILLQPIPRASIVDLSPGRRTLWFVALMMAADRPLLGVGPDNFRLAYGRYTGQDVWDSSVHANNIYLEMLADMGVPGALAFLAFAAATLWTAWRALRRSTFPSLSAWERGFKGGQSESLSPWERGPEDRLGVAADFPLAAAGAAALTTWLVHGLFDFFYPFLPVALVYWAILGLTAALARDGDR